MFSASELLTRIESGASPVVLDVRSRAEYSAGHVPGSVHIPFWRLLFDSSRVAAARDASIVVYCGHGPRARIAAAALRRHGFTRVECLAGHMAEWTRQRRPQERLPNGE